VEMAICVLGKKEEKRKIKEKEIFLLSNNIVKRHNQELSAEKQLLSRYTASEVFSLPLDESRASSITSTCTLRIRDTKQSTTYCLNVQCSHFFCFPQIICATLIFQGMRQQSLNITAGRMSHPT